MLLFPPRRPEAGKEWYHSPMMVEGRVKFTLLLVLAILCTAVQCVSSCAGEGCSPANTNLPPCHRHNPTPTHEMIVACGQDFLVPGTAASSAGTVTQIIPPIADLTIPARTGSSLAGATLQCKSAFSRGHKSSAAAVLRI